MCVWWKCLNIGRHSCLDFRLGGHGTHGYVQKIGPLVCLGAAVHQPEPTHLLLTNQGDHLPNGPWLPPTRPQHLRGTYIGFQLNVTTVQHFCHASCRWVFLFKETVSWEVWLWFFIELFLLLHAEVPSHNLNLKSLLIHRYILKIAVFLKIFPSCEYL